MLVVVYRSLQAAVTLDSASTAVNAFRTTRTCAAVRKVFKDLVVSTVSITLITLSTVARRRYTTNVPKCLSRHCYAAATLELTTAIELSSLSFNYVVHTVTQCACGVFCIVYNITCMSEMFHDDTAKLLM